MWLNGDFINEWIEFGGQFFSCERRALFSGWKGIEASEQCATSMSDAHTLIGMSQGSQIALTFLTVGFYISMLNSKQLGINKHFR